MIDIGDPAHWPCPHRLEILREERCQLCGQRDLSVPVYACAKQGECTILTHGIRHGRREPHLPVCLTCPDNPQGLAAFGSPSPGTPQPIVPVIHRPAPKPITLRVPCAPGDNVVATSVVWELARRYPGRYAVTIRTHYPQIWEHNPDIVAVEPAGNADDPYTATSIDDRGLQDGTRRWLNVEAQELLDVCNDRPVHYLQGVAHNLRHKLRLPSLDVTRFRGRVYLSPEEMASDPFAVLRASLPIWLINAGGKLDNTCKLWPTEHWQATIDALADRVQFVQVGALEADSGGHVHPEFRAGSVIDLRGRTDHATLRRLVHHADGIVCGNTYLMHLAAAVDPPASRSGRRSPCVVIAGGREPLNWYAYPGHTVLSSIGQYDCCGSGGCWKDRVYPLGDGRTYDDPEKLCSQPVGSIARCMAEITPADVIRAIERNLRMPLDPTRK